MPSAHAFRTSWGAEMEAAGGVRYRLWAPAARSVGLVVIEDRERTLPMEPMGSGWYECTDPRSHAGTRYAFLIDGSLRVADPAARFMPDGPHAASQVIDPLAFAWPDGLDACVRPFAEMVFYELHVGTFTPEGTYAAAAEHLSDLAALGVTAIELMPLSQAAGERNWGYDGVGHYAPAHSYGTTDELKQLVSEAHRRKLCVFLDVVYNHFGPEGNYLHAYAPQTFTQARQTPWGAAIDYASESNDPVRTYAIENACFWLGEYRFDGLRLDAIDAIYDPERAFLRALAARARTAAGRPVHLVVENDRNEAQMLRETFDAQWNDDVHHCLHAAIAGERDGYYADYPAPVASLGRALTSGFAYQGETSAFRNGQPRGERSGDIPLAKFVNFLQNHDQIGNRAFGERIGQLAAAEAVKAATAVLLLAPSPPLLFMGQEWAATAPFLFFCDFEPALAMLVTQGRRAEFARFERFADARAREAIADPSSPQTRAASTLDWSERERSEHRQWLGFHERLLRIRREEIVPRAAVACGNDASFQTVGERGLRAQWRIEGAILQLEANLGLSVQPGFETSAGGRELFSTHAAFPDDCAPPWSVRWSVW